MSAQAGFKGSAVPPVPGAARAAGYRRTITVLGVGQIFAWGSSFYLPAVLAKPIADDTGLPLTWVVGGLSLGLLAAGPVFPPVRRPGARRGGPPHTAGCSVFLFR